MLQSNPEIYEYAIFFATLSFGGIIAICVYFFGGKHITLNGYFFGEKNMNFITIGISVAVSHFFGTILAIPVEVYKYGSDILFVNISAILVALLAIFVYLPVFYKLQLTSVFEYLSKRFDERMKYFGLSLYVLGETITFSYGIYLCASLYLESFSIPLNIYLIYFGLCAFCIFYTTLGGLKTIVWTDICYFVLIVTPLIIICSIDLVKSGGISSVYKSASSGERIDFNFKINPLKREGFWHIVFGYTATRISRIVVHQTGVQKYLSLPRFQNCIWSVICGGICQCFIMTLCVLLGILMYTKYAKCDPTVFGIKSEELLVVYVNSFTDVFPGLSAIFAASLVADALSSMSSLLHSLSCVIYNDVFTKFFNNGNHTMSQVKIGKLIVVVSGVLCTCLFFLIKYCSVICLALRDSISGALLGIFTLGMLVPNANSKGAYYGGITGFTSIFAHIMVVRYHEFFNFFSHPTKQFGTLCEKYTTEVQYTDATANLRFVKISFYYYTLIGALLTIIVGVIVSYFTKKSNKLVDKRLISPVCYFLLKTKNEENKASCSNAEGEVLLVDLVE